MSSTEVYRQRIYENEGFTALVDLISPSHSKVLDIGCGNGANLHLLAQRGIHGVGVTLSEAEAQIVLDRGYHAIVWDISQPDLPFPSESFDALIFSHVLEHLPWPEEVLRRYATLLKPGGNAYIALPNVMQFMQRWQFIRGRFRYTETGLMDRTHLRFFDSATARQLAQNAGLHIVRFQGVGMCPMGPLREWAPRYSRKMDRLVTRLFPGIFAFHLVLIAQKR
ncbi:MAG TPA: class I SAM-dependent methyltransferase [Chloroflexi bacterium]|nr:class I SAM-dependent methyltransferase [Chloroflexota bacterium]HHW87788.1 class I SAM-dependent methyltransferase [Chloroflexota bacterium]